MRLAVKGANKQHAVAVCAAARLLDEKPSELLGATLNMEGSFGMENLMLRCEDITGQKVSVPIKNLRQI